MNLEVELKERVARRAIQLMPQPRTALRLRKLVADPEHSLTQVIDAIKVDPMLAAAVLRIANSASHARGQPTTSLSTAITRIGEKELARLALASGLGVASTGAGPLLALRRGAMQDALTSALICERLAPEFGLDAERLFLEGLLHDVGRLVALATLELILAQHPKAPPLEPEAWLALAQAHHVELGRVLAERWSLPPGVGQVIEVHHLPDDGAPDAASVVRLSDALLELLHAGFSLGESRLPWLARIEPARRGPLLEALNAIPSLVAAFEAERPAATHSAVISTATPLEAPRGPVFPVKVSGGRVGELMLLSARRLLLHTDAQLPDNHLEELEVQLPEGPLELWVRVTHSSGVGSNGRAEAEATLFAPTPEVALRLKDLWCAAPSPAELAA
ncbi:MAG: HDOD domain-containing protein [Archangium sp.]|nr:HDOD domain-containing protein [Archangium sp.]